MFMEAKSRDARHAHALVPRYWACHPARGGSRWSSPAERGGPPGLAGGWRSHKKRVHSRARFGKSWLAQMAEGGVDVGLETRCRTVSILVAARSARGAGRTTRR